MGDLISRSALIKYLTVDGYIPKAIKEAIELQPTAYDLEEVLAELEVDTVNVDAIIGRHIVNVKMINADRAINIVKAGGTDGKIDRC